MDDNIIEKLYPLYQKFAKNHYSVVPELEGYYLTNIFSGECLICLDYIWNGSFRDVCKYCHAAKIYKESLNAENLFDYSQEVKNQLVTYFKNKKRVISAENKNKLIYEGDTHVAYNEILRLFELQGTKIFWSDNKPLKLNRDPFRPELSKKIRKIRKPFQLSKEKQNKLEDKFVHIRIMEITRIMKIIWDHLYLMLIYLLRITSNFDLNPSFNSHPTLQPTLYNIPYYTNTNTSLPTSIYSQSTFSSTNAIPNSNYTSFNIPQDQLAYSYPLIPNDLGQFSYNNQIELSNSYSYSFNQAPDNNFSDNNTFSQKHF
ncbi:unnamed protein product [Rhizophagus irregularis]|nr:unnamed protein product [Rhizophagus irregularis]